MPSYQAKKLQLASTILHKQAKENGVDSLNILARAAESFAGLDRGSIEVYLPDPHLSTNIHTGALEQEIMASGVPAPKALSVLATPEMAPWTAKQQGSYYTDYRLARDLAATLPEPGVSLDPACGTGILLTSLANQIADDYQRDEWLANSVHGRDLDQRAVDGAFISLASHATNDSVLPGLRANLRLTDGLLETPLNADTVIGNPPWERLRATRHETWQSEGGQGAYGTPIENETGGRHQSRKSELNAYLSKLKDMYPAAATREPDLYAFFLESSIQNLRDGGQLGMVLPAGLIRSQQTQALRGRLLDSFKSVAMDLRFNHERYFDIDSRVKFLLVSADGKGAGPSTSIHFQQNENDVVCLDVSTLRQLRPDLTVPEISSPVAWNLFHRLSRDGQTMSTDAGLWAASVTRELDMTRHKSLFQRTPERNALPLIEGRMVHQFTPTAKQYVDGTGRSARWDQNPWVGEQSLASQYHVALESLPKKLQSTVQKPRIAYADVTGQTNERTMMATVVPEGAVCGNKAPTLHFISETQGIDVAWMAIANSFVFDWLLRRVITTTANVFILKSIPLPNETAWNKHGLDLVRAAQEVLRLQGQVDPNADIAYAEARAVVDAIVAQMYDLNFDDVNLILEDFPLVDRKQPADGRGKKSTITKDLFRAQFLEQSGGDSEECRLRVQTALAAGARGYIPNQFMRA